jgi:hypothetical protein
MLALVSKGPVAESEVRFTPLSRNASRDPYAPNCHLVQLHLGSDRHGSRVRVTNLLKPSSDGPQFHGPRDRTCALDCSGPSYMCKTQLQL